MRLGGVTMPAPEVELSFGPVDISLVYKTGGGTVRGVVEKCASGGVLLVQQDLLMRLPGFVRNAICDSNDRYEITAVRPGEYYALAFSQVWRPKFDTGSFSMPREYFAVFMFSDHGSTPAWAPKFDDGLLNQASRITVRAGEVSSADLHPVARPPY